MRYGFIGLGTMGVPIAQHMINGNFEVQVWNRSPERYSLLDGDGVKPSESVEELFETCDCIFLMLSTEAAIDQILRRDGSGHSQYFQNRIIVNMGTFSSAYSKGLADSIHSAGGQFVESPVSGSRVPAERGELVAMLAGEKSIVSQVEPVIKTACSSTVYCGQVPSALLMKHATNMLLIPMMIGIAEASAFARCSGLDIDLFQSILGGGQMSCGLVNAKLPKIIEQDYSSQSSIQNVFVSALNSVRSAEHMQHKAPLTELCCRLLQAGIDSGLAEEDVLALEKVIGNVESRND